MVCTYAGKVIYARLGVFNELVVVTSCLKHSKRLGKCHFTHCIPCRWTKLVHSGNCQTNLVRLTVQDIIRYIKRRPGFHKPPIQLFTQEINSPVY